MAMLWTSAAVLCWATRISAPLNPGCTRNAAPVLQARCAVASRGGGLGSNSWYRRPMSVDQSLS